MKEPTKTPIPPDRSPNKPRYDAVILFIILSLPLLLILGSAIINGQRPLTPQDIDHISGKLRGNIVIVIRKIEYQQVTEDITVSEDGVSTRGKGAYPDDYSRVQLTRDDWQEANDIREQWCKNQPIQEQISQEQPHYTIAIKCGGIATRTIKLLPAHLPDALQTLYDIIPSPRK